MNSFNIFKMCLLIKNLKAIGETIYRLRATFETIVDLDFDLHCLLRREMLEVISHTCLGINPSSEKQLGRGEEVSHQ